GSELAYQPSDASPQVRPTEPLHDQRQRSRPRAHLRHAARPGGLTTVRKATLCVYDDYVGHNIVTLCSTMLFSLMGRSDRLALHAIVDDVSLTGTNPGTFDLFVEGSADGQNWVQRNGAATTIGHGDISLTGIGTTGTQAMWSDGALQLG